MACRDQIRPAVDRAIPATSADNRRRPMPWPNGPAPVPVQQPQPLIQPIIRIWDTAQSPFHCPLQRPRLAHHLLRSLHAPSRHTGQCPPCFQSVHAASFVGLRSVDKGFAFRWASTHIRSNVASCRYDATTFVVAFRLDFGLQRHCADVFRRGGRCVRNGAAWRLHHRQKQSR